MIPNTAFHHKFEWKNRIKKAQENLVVGLVLLDTPTKSATELALSPTMDNTNRIKKTKGNFLHKSTYQHKGIRIQNDTVKANDMFMVNGVHNGCFFKEFHWIVLHSFFAKAFNCNLYL